MVSSNKPWQVFHPVERVNKRAIAAYAAVFTRGGCPFVRGCCRLFQEVQALPIGCLLYRIQQLDRLGSGTHASYSKLSPLRRNAGGVERIRI